MTGIRSATSAGAALVALSLLALAWSAHYVAGQLLSGWGPSGAADVSGGIDASSEARSASDYDVSRIMDAHLFGRMEQPTVVRAEPAPETKLQISLLGLIASADDDLARAIIRVGGAGVKPYGIGQAIDGTDATLDSVESRRVLLRRGQALESLALKRESLDNTGESTGLTITSPDAAQREPSSTATNRTGERLDQSTVEQMKQPF